MMMGYSYMPKFMASFMRHMMINHWIRITNLFGQTELILSISRKKCLEWSYGKRSIRPLI